METSNTDEERVESDDDDEGEKEAEARAEAKGEVQAAAAERAEGGGGGGCRRSAAGSGRRKQRRPLFCDMRHKHRCCNMKDRSRRDDHADPIQLEFVGIEFGEARTTIFLVTQSWFLFGFLGDKIGTGN